MKLKLLQGALAIALAFWSFAAPPARAQNVGGGMMDASLVSFVNRSSRTLYIGFSPQPGRSVPFSWSPDCARINEQVVLAPGETCAVSVPSSAGASRFCALEHFLPPGKTPDCFAAQRDGLTIIETNFTSRTGCAKSPGDTAMRSCVWYAINVTPEGCTNTRWPTACDAVSYNVPVQLFCPGQTTFTCRGPFPPGTCGRAPRPPYVAPIPIGGPSNANQQAFFFPMSTSGAAPYPPDMPQPIDRCPEGGKLFVIFPDGP